MEIPEEVRKYMSELGKKSAQANKGKRDFKAMSKKGLDKRWGHRRVSAKRKEPQGR